MLSRCSYLIKNGDKKGLIDLVSKSFDVFIFVICTFSFGISAVSKEFIPLFFGNGYDKCVLLTILLSVVMIFKTLQCIVTNQLLVPLKKDHIFIKSVIIGAGVNVLLNTLFIGYLKCGSLGAVIGTIIAEFFVCCYQLFYICKHYHLLKDILKGLSYIIFGAIMFVSVFYFDNFVNTSRLITLMIKVVIGASIYLSLSFIYWIFTKNDNFRFILNILRKKS